MNRDYEAQLRLRLSAEGIDAATALESAIQRLRGEWKANAAALADGSTEAEKSIAAMAKIERQISQLIQALQELSVAERKRNQDQLNDEAKANAARLKSIDADAKTAELKGEAEEKAAKKIQAALDKATAARMRATEKDRETEQKALADLKREIDERIALLDREAQVEADANARRLQQAREFHDENVRLGNAKIEEGQRQLAATIIATNRALAGHSPMMANYVTQANQGRQASEKMSYGLLHVAHAFQDLQYGFGAVLNNIPLVVQAFGGGPGLAGTIMMVGTAVAMAKPFIGDLTVMLGLAEDKAKDAGTTIDGLKGKISALTEKGWKLAVDYHEIDVARDKLAKLEAAKQAFDAGKEGPEKAFVKGIAGEKVELAGGTAAVGKLFADADAAAGIVRADQSDIDNLAYYKNAASVASRAAASLASKGQQSASLAAAKVAEYYSSKAAESQQAIKESSATYYETMGGNVALGDPRTLQILRGMIDTGRVPNITAEQKQALMGIPYTKEMGAELYKQQTPLMKLKDERSAERQQKVARTERELSEQGMANELEMRNRDQAQKDKEAAEAQKAGEGIGAMMDAENLRQQKAAEKAKEKAEKAAADADAKIARETASTLGQAGITKALEMEALRGAAMGMSPDQVNPEIERMAAAAVARHAGNLTPEQQRQTSENVLDAASQALMRDMVAKAGNVADTTLAAQSTLQQMLMEMTRNQMRTINSNVNFMNQVQKLQAGMGRANAAPRMIMPIQPPQ